MLPLAQFMRCHPSLQTLLKDGVLRTNIPKLSAFSGERAKGEVSFEQWSYELQTLRKTYSDFALWEGIQHCLRGAAADTVRNLGPSVPLGTIIKKITIVYGNVKSFDLLRQDFYHADQGEEESIPSFATRIEGLLSKIRDRLPDKLPHLKEQRLLMDHLFHRCKKSIQDSVKYCFADPHIQYMHFLEECRKAEDEDKVGQQAKTGTTKAKVQQPQYHPPGKMSWLSNSSTSSTKLIPWWGRLKTWSQLSKPQGSPPKGPWQVAMGGNPKHMERWF